MNPHKNKITLITMEIDNPLTIKLELDISLFINKRSVQKKSNVCIFKESSSSLIFSLGLTGYFLVFSFLLLNVACALFDRNNELYSDEEA